MNFKCKERESLCFCCRQCFDLQASYLNPDENCCVSLLWLVYLEEYLKNKSRLFHNIPLLGTLSPGKLCCSEHSPKAQKMQKQNLRNRISSCKAPVWTHAHTPILLLEPNSFKFIFHFSIFQKFHKSAGEQTNLGARTKAK